MNTKNIFKALTLAMLMPAMLLTTACSNDDDFVTNNNEQTIKKGFELPVTVNATRQDDATRATYNATDKKLEFSTGDKLFVSGSASGAGKFAGALDYVPATGKFSGTIYTQNEWDSTADALFSAAPSIRAILLPNGYDSYNFLSISNNNTPDVAYDDVVSGSIANAFVASETPKATGVEQLSWEQAYTYSSGFALAPANAVLSFTISGLEAGTKTATLITTYSGIDFDQTISGSVTPNASGVASFAMGVPNNLIIKNVANNLTVGSSKFTLPSTALAAGKIFNINRSASAPLPAVFTVDAGKTVKFSKGNLQATYNGSSWIWGFAEHQWDYIGNAAGNTSINGNGTVSANGTVDLFGWVGTSSTWTGVAQYGISNSTVTNNVDGYGNVGGEDQKVGWGATVGTGWRTLTRLEWLYLLSTRETGITVNSTNHARYTMAIINTDGTAVKGLIIFPDSYSGGSPAGVTWGTINAKSIFETTCTSCTSAGWTALEAAGCVFLPAAGYREGSTVKDAGDGAGYWSSSSSNAPYAFGLYFESDYMTIQYGGNRKYGFSVRLVRNAD